MNLRVVRHTPYLIGTFLILSVLYTLHFSRPTLEEAAFRNDFAHYYCSATLLTVETLTPYGISLGDCYQKHGFINDPPIQKATNPPGLLGITLFLPKFSPFPSYLLWQFSQLFALLATVLLFGRKACFSRKQLLLIFCWFLASHPLWTHIAYAQAQLLIAAFMLLGVILLQKGKTISKILGSAFLGMTAGIKLFSFPLLIPLSLCYGRLAFMSFLAGALLAQLPLLILTQSLEPFHSFFLKAYPDVSHAAYTFSGISSIPGLARQLHPINAAFAEKIHYGIFLLSWIIILYYWWKQRKKMREEETMKPLYLAEAIGFCIYFSPVSWVHYLVVLVVPLLILMDRFTKRKEHVLLLLTALTACGLCMQNGQGSSEPGTINLSILILLSTCVLFFSLIRKTMKCR